MEIRARGDLKAIDFLAALSSPLGSIIIMIAIKIALPKRAAAGEQVPFHHSSGTSWASFWLLLYSADISFGFFFWGLFDPSLVGCGPAAKVTKSRSNNRLQWQAASSEKKGQSMKILTGYIS